LKALTAGTLVLLLGVFLAAGTGLPAFGDPAAPAATHVAAHYVEHAYHDAHTPNIVTVMIADYRGFDTLGETMVVFAAGLACALLLLPRGGGGRIPRMLQRETNLIAEVVTRIMIPLVVIFALYVVFHGHYSPGGGFQGGALIAAAVLLARVVIGRARSESMFPVGIGRALGAIGLLIYGGIGFLTLALGGDFLEYDRLPLGASPAWSRYWGILGVELGVALAVMGTLVSIFDDLGVGGR
jgi:multicomponent Na+:H+ antiporter subunit B